MQVAILSGKIIGI